MNRRQARQAALEMLAQVGFADAEGILCSYPHELSGGMRQRVLIAMAMACRPRVLIADEPTSALDVTTQAQVLEQLTTLAAAAGTAILLITHDLGIVADMADRVAVMYAGQLVEEAGRDRFYAAAAHPYSRKLFRSLPNVRKREQALDTIRGTVPALNRQFTGCRFAERCDVGWDYCGNHVPAWNTVSREQHARCHRADPAIDAPALPATTQPAADMADRPSTHEGVLLEVTDLKVHFPIHKGIFKRIAGHVYAVDGVSLAIPRGSTLALVGESGCGKTTAGKGILQLIRPTGGNVRFDGTELTRLRGEALRARRADFQFIFQDPYSSMNPRMMVGDIVEEGMVAQGISKTRAERQARVASLFEQVGLSPAHMQRYPHEFSGGQRQRICIARALAVDPQLVICDEPTSALDVSVQAQILNLLKKLQNSLGLSYLFITHNLSVVSYLADRVAVMYLGRIVEEGPVAEVLERPQHPYTRALLSAVPTLDADARREIIRLEGDMPSPARPPAGCHFHPRCPEAMPQCAQSYPNDFGTPGHPVRCFLYR
jgi:peptide/nickel transport system ATP-binding protein